MTIRWITECLGTAAAEEVRGQPGLALVDVRDLVDKAGNSAEAVRGKIQTGVAHLQSGAKTVVCCDYGISRSNAVAVGILAVHESLTFLQAVRVVQEKTGEKEIKLGPLEAVRRALGEDAGPGSCKSRRTVLVTGASGGIGTAVCKQLASEFEVIAPARAQLDIELGCTQLSLLVAEHAVDSIVHLASPKVYTSNVALGQTLTMLRNVLEVCAIHGTSLIYPSSSEIYSGYSGYQLADEELPAFPAGPHGEAKYLAEELIQQFQRTSDLSCTVIRSSPIYGADGDKPKFIFNFIGKATRSEAIVTHRYSSGDASLDLLHVSDFVDAVSRVCVQTSQGTINVGTGVTTPTRDIAALLKQEIGGNSSIEQIQVESSSAIIAMDYQKATRLLGWRPTVELVDGLKGLLPINSSRE